MSRIIYTGVFLDDESKQKLVEYTKKVLTTCPFQDYSIFCDHMTCQFHTNASQEEMRAFVEHNQGLLFHLEATHVGFSDKAMCVKVSSTISSNNEMQHITLATFNGGKPVDSNKITAFGKLSQPMRLNGYVKAFEV